MTWRPRGRRRDQQVGAASLDSRSQLGYVVRAGSTIGIRRTNQDRVLLAHPIVAVADGVGGSVRGDAAAQVSLGRIAIDSAYAQPDEDPAQTVRGLVRGADAEAQKAARAFGAVESSSTLALLHLSRPEEATDDVVLLTVAWVGDSPVLVADQHGVEQLTIPHTDAPSGHASEGYALLRALGGTDATPDVTTRLVAPPCRVVLATDGLLDVPREVIEAVLLDLELDTDRCLEELLDLVRDVRVSDNTTIAVVDLVRSEERTILTGLL
ncbi:PP2C family protein-serine/threonine phosphatase [Nocardioides zhouii]|uniref:Protein serine/threonine phosphatase 2C family protein n=1 Tax=Nocardioides zhouii TaxID=1168729 RepID=A0A4Q2SJJ0_9ACTN|nr:PP2C family protein-serine/threonine phosphatase [Nocardioides zhouii]RYC05735.1 protein serine/threonine phosphatase 2C family protein [Nocardioides zhouii]